MDTDTPQPAAPKRRRRWFQFRLRTLFVVTTIVATFASVPWYVPDRGFHLVFNEDGFKSVAAFWGIIGGIGYAAWKYVSAIAK